MARRRVPRDPGAGRRLERRSIGASLLALAMLAPAMAGADDKRIDAPAFTAIEVSSGIAAVVHAGGAIAVVAHGDAQGVAALRTEVKDGILRAWMETKALGPGGHRVTLDIGVAELGAILASGGASIDISNWSGEALSAEADGGASIRAHEARGTAFVLRADGGGSLVISGACDSADASSSAGARLDAVALACADVVARATGGAALGIGASRSVDAEASNGASITVRGRPTRTHTVSKNGGSIRVE